MGLKDILVHVDSTCQSATRVEVAARLAHQHDAHLTGIYVISSPHISPTQDFGQLPVEYIEQREKDSGDRAIVAEKSFLNIADQHGVTHEWRCETGLALDIISMNSRYSDVVILGQRDPNNAEDFGDLPDGIIMTSGRSVLVIPYTGKVESLGERVMIGWDGSAQAARAIHDSIPLIAAADRVDIIAVNPNGSGDHGETPAADISLHLARHGIKTEAQSITVNDIGIADILLSRASDRGIDLFVMGAYGHSRWRELVLGGVTAHMLEHMTMPVLMAH